MLKSFKQSFKQYASPRITVLAATLLLLQALFTGLAYAESPTIRQSPNDPRSYELLTLDNGLRALVISDPETDKAAASLNVDVGSSQDPKDRAGLAHFLEHMLFLGTEKYPQAGAYQAFISEQGGMHNAFTAPDRTNYFFEVNSASLEPALDRFAQFFIAPLFSAEYVQRERHAVNSEYQSKLKDDGRRIYAALKQTYNPAHPLAHFAVGNLETLADREGSNVRDELIAFYERYYSANIMSLVVLGKQPLDELKALVTEKFAAVPNRNATTPQAQAELFAPGTLPAQLEVATVKDLRELTLTFPLPPVREHYRSKPLQYLGSLLGNEGTGSLLARLKELGWAESLSAGNGLDSATEATLSISIGLTEAGLSNTDTIIALVFQYLRLIDDKGVHQRFFDEERRLGEMSFRFQEPSNPVYLVSHLASKMRQFASEDLLSGNYLYHTYQPALIRDYLKRLSPENLLVTLATPDRETDKTDPWFDTPYRLTPISAERRQRWQQLPVDPALTLPEPNPFLADDYSVKPFQGKELPTLLAKQIGMRLWYQQDNTFKTPRTDFYFSFRSPVANDTPRHAVMTALYLQLVEDKLNPITYRASVAGLKTSLYPHIRGFSLRLSGFSQKQPLLLRQVVSELRNYRVDPQRLEIYRDQLRQSLENSFKDKPYNQALDRVQLRLIDPQWSEQEKLAELDTISAEELQAFIAKLYARGEVEALAHGNLTAEQARSLIRPLQTTLLNGVKPTAVPSGTTRQLNSERRLEELTLEHNDSAITVYLQGNEKSFAERARYGLLAQIISVPFYHQLRTEKQLGYVVFASPMPILEHPGIALVVQSPSATASQLEAHVDQFLGQVPRLVKELDAEALERHKQSLILKLLKKEQRLSERSDRYWQEIDRGHLNFDSRERLADAVRAVTPEELQKLSQAFTAKRLVVRSTGQALQNGLQGEVKDS